MNNPKKKRPWKRSIASMIISGFFSFAFIDEWIKLQRPGTNEGYPYFGVEPNQTIQTLILIYGIGLSLGFIFSMLLFLFRKPKVATIVLIINITLVLLALLTTG